MIHRRRELETFRKGINWDINKRSAALWLHLGDVRYGIRLRFDRRPFVLTHCHKRTDEDWQIQPHEKREWDRGSHGEEQRCTLRDLLETHGDL